jgi:peptide deformylase
MTKLDIITIPDPLLKTVSEPVERVDAELIKFMDDMLETMYAAPGIGLAAVQVGVPRRVLVADAARDEEPKNPVYMINPEILDLSDEMRLHEEGCLSIPEIYAEVERPAACRVRFTAKDGKIQELEAEGLLSTVIQHEVDHLNGVLFIDHLSKLKRDILIKKYMKAQKAEETS